MSVTDQRINWALLLVLVAAIFFINRAYRALAVRHGRKEWVFTIIGLLVFFAGSGIGRIVGTLVKIPVIQFPLGILLAAVVYQILKRNLAKR